MKMVHRLILSTINLSIIRRTPLAKIIVMNSPLIITAIPPLFNSLVKINVAQTMTNGLTIKNGVILIFVIFFMFLSLLLTPLAWCFTSRRGQMNYQDWHSLFSLPSCSMSSYVKMDEFWMILIFTNTSLILNEFIF